VRQFCIPVTDEPVSLSAARAALTWCKQLGVSAVVLNVVTIPPLHRTQRLEQVRLDLVNRSQRFLETWQAYARHHHQTLETLCVVQDGRGVAQTINDTALSSGCDVIAMGTHGLEGINRAVMGSVTEAVIRHARLPVLVFGHGVNPRKLERVMVAVDGSLGSDLAVRAARGWAERTGASVQVLHVTSDPFMPVHFRPATATFEHDLGRATARVIARAERDLESIERLPSLIVEPMRRGVATVILETARDAAVDLLVLGTQGRSGVERLLLGSVAEDVVRHATMPVLLVHGTLTLEAVWDRTYRTEFDGHRN
jgi:nucleotide-binding universal stress UspA family protein